MSDKGQAEDTFQAIRAQLQSLIDRVPLAIVTIGRDERVQMWNAAAEHIFGWTAAEVLGQPLPIVPEEQEEEYRALIAADLQGARLDGREIRRRRKDGALVDVSLWSVPLRNDAGEVAGSIGFFADISRQKHAEAALADRTGQLEAVQAVSAEIIRELDLWTVLRLVTQRACELTRATTGDLVLWDAERQVLVPGATYGQTVDPPLTTRQLGEGAMGAVAQRRQGMIINDYRASELAHPLLLGKTRITASLLEPLLFGDRLLGVIGVDHEVEGRTFTGRDQATLKLFATQAAIAIENARLYQALSEREERFRQVVENIREVFWIVTPDWEQVLYISPAYEEVWGRPRAGLYAAARSWLEPVVAEDQPPLLLAMAARTAGNFDPPDFPEFRIRRPDGTLRWILARAYPIRDAGGQVRRIAGIAEDITRRKRGEQRLAERTRQLEAVRAVTAEITRELDRTTLLQLIIRRAAELVGADSGEVWLWDEDAQDLKVQAWHGIAGRHLLRLKLGEGITGRVAERRRGLIVNEYPLWSNALPPERLNRTIAHMLAQPLLYQDRLLGVINVATGEAATPFTENHRTLLHLFAIQAAIAIENARLYEAAQQDLAERIRAEETLKRYQLLADQARDIMLFVRTDGQILEANGAATLAYGYTPAEMKSLNIQDLRAAETQPLTAQQMAQADADGILFETVHRRKDGRTFPVEVSSRGTPWGKDRILLSIIRDITDRKLVEAQTRQAQKMEALGTLAGGIVHDFNNLLSSLVGFTELATDDVPRKSPAWAHLQDALAVAGRAKDLAQQILTFSRRREQERKPVALPELVQESLRLVRAALPNTIEIRAHVEPGVGLVLADATQIHQVVLNLCTNAEHAMRKRGGVLDLRLEAVTLDAAFAAAHPPLREGPHIRLVVADTGHGMAPDVRERIFDPFFTTKGPGEGTGMGLAVVHGIVAGHTGAITVESAPGRGTTFTVYLPECVPAEVGPVAAEPLTRGSGERLLIIDDEAPIARIWGQMLESLGYHTVSCTSSREALDTVRAAPDQFDLVITDLVMPHLPGDQLAEELLRLRSDLPIILCSGYGRMMTDQEAKAMGIRAFLQKPFGRRELGLAVQQALRQGTVRGT